jgi:hypothetical protein
VGVQVEGLTQEGEGAPIMQGISVGPAGNELVVDMEDPRQLIIRQRVAIRHVVGVLSIIVCGTRIKTVNRRS